VFAALPEDWVQFTFTSLLLNFYILLSLVAGIRISFQALNYLFRRERDSGKHALIYGAGTNGMLMLQKILNDDTSKLMPVGFLDDDPSLEGKCINGYPIFGGHWKLEGLIHRLNVEKIIIASDAIKPEIIRRLYAIAQSHRIVIRRSSIRIENPPASRKKHQVHDVFAYAGR
jgi:FlaA1/EpsC-like NDP-sugar epimerase